MKETMPRDFLEEVRMKMASLHALALDPQGRVSIEVANLTRPVTRLSDVSSMKIGTILHIASRGKFEKKKFGNVEKWVNRRGNQESNAFFFFTLVENHYNDNTVTLLEGGYLNGH